ncbi:hypothetical protein SVAN01_10059 [Stagonosporopsis vannaccii]|nr:hypothetical protein SVAN01_10059 [Stagonosporopsis vannaccii]
MNRRCSDREQLLGGLNVRIGTFICCSYRQATQSVTCWIRVRWLSLTQHGLTSLRG